MSKKPNKKPPYNANSAIRSAIRRTYSRSPMVKEVMNKVRRERPWYRKNGTVASKPRVEFLCARCQEWHMGKNIEVDHSIPVIDPLVGFVDWNTFIERLFCNIENLSVLCDPCHTAKTNAEKSIAVERRKRLKAEAAR